MSSSFKLFVGREDLYEEVLNRSTSDTDMNDANSDRHHLLGPMTLALFIAASVFWGGSISSGNEVALVVAIALSCAVVLGAAFTWKGWKTVKTARAKYYRRKDALVKAIGKPLDEKSKRFATVLIDKAEMITVSGRSFLKLETLHGVYVVQLPSDPEEVLNVHYWTTLGRGTAIVIDVTKILPASSATAVAVCNVDVSDEAEVTIHVEENTILSSESS